MAWASRIRTHKTLWGREKKGRHSILPNDCVKIICSWTFWVNQILCRRTHGERFGTPSKNSFIFPKLTEYKRLDRLPHAIISISLRFIPPETQIPCYLRKILHKSNNINGLVDKLYTLGSRKNFNLQPKSCQNSVVTISNSILYFISN